MRKYVMLALNGIKKKKGDTVALLILIGFATIMMYIGISVFSNVVNVLDQVNERNHGADQEINCSAGKQTTSIFQSCNSGC